MLPFSDGTVMELTDLDEPLLRFYGGVEDFEHIVDASLTINFGRGRGPNTGTRRGANFGSNRDRKRKACRS